MLRVTLPAQCPTRSPDERADTKDRNAETPNQTNAEQKRESHAGSPARGLHLALSYCGSLLHLTQAAIVLLFRRRLPNRRFSPSAKRVPVVLLRRRSVVVDRPAGGGDIGGLAGL